jgi:hypothetical protein
MLTRNQWHICSSDENWLRSYLQTGWQCGDKESGVVPPQMMEPKDLVAKHFIYANETAIPMTVQCVRIVKSRVGVVKLCIIVQHTPANLDLVPKIVLNYTTWRWTSSAKIKECFYRSHLSRLETKNYLPFFLFKCFSKLVQIVGYLIATRGTVSPLIKYNRKRLIHAVNIRFIKWTVSSGILCC